MGNFRWTQATATAVELVVADELTDEQIAEKCGVSRRTLATWKTHPEFADKVEENLEDFRRKVLGRGVADRARRVHALDKRWRKMHQVISERAASPEMEGVPGGTTGLICRYVKGLGRGDDFEKVEVYEVDTGLLREMRELEKQAAQELGQWTERSDVNATVKSYETGNGPDDL